MTIVLDTQNQNRAFCIALLLDERSHSVVHKKKEVTLIITSKTRFYKVPAAAKVFLGLSKIEGKGKLGKTKDL